jgi:hypothetical protein
MAGTEAILARYSLLDRDAVGIYGGSYGGFMTKYLVTATDMYAAAVSMYGISDLATYWGQGTWGWTYGDMALGGATPWANPQYFIEHSPLFQADKIKHPPAAAARPGGHQRGRRASRSSSSPPFRCWTGRWRWSCSPARTTASAGAGKTGWLTGP